MNCVRNPLFHYIDGREGEMVGIFEKNLKKKIQYENVSCGKSIKKYKIIQKV